MNEQKHRLSPDQIWSLANDQLTSRLASRFVPLIGVALLLSGVLEWLRGTPDFGLIMLVGSGVIFMIHFLPIPLRLRGRALLVVLFSTYFIIHLMSGGRTIGILIALPMFVMLSGLIDSLRMSIVWASLSVSLILTANLVQELLISSPVVPDPEWVQGSLQRIPVLMCVMAVFIAALYQGGIRGYSRQLLESDRALDDRNRVLRFEEQRLTDFTQLAADWYWETDAEHRLIFLSERFEDMYGMSTEDALGKTPMDLYETFHEPTEEANRQLALLDSHEPFSHVRMLWRDPQGKLIILDNHGRPVFDDEGCFTGYRGIVHDITESEALRRELARQAHHDELTGVANRRALFAHLDQHLDGARHQAVCVLDLDDFKQVNDRGGHAAGDQVLIDVANRMARHLGEMDFLARLGGDEFCMLIEQHSVTDMTTLCKRIVDDIHSYSLPWQGLSLQVGASIGICLCPAGLKRINATDVIRQADQACYEAKQKSDGVHLVRYSNPAGSAVQDP